MKRRLQRIYWRGILITLVMAMAAIGMAAWLKIDDTRAHLDAMLDAALKWTRDSGDDLQSLSDTIAGISPGLRVTYLLDSGLILADSEQKEELPGDPLEDAEIAAVRRGEIGKQLRMSAEDASLTLYLAGRVSPQLILRLSIPVIETARVLMVYGTALLLLFLTLYLVQRRGIARLAADQSRQFDDIRLLMDGETDRVQAVFPEFQPSLDAISYRVRRLKEDHREVLRTLNLRANFVANASHELRSPLTSVRGYAEILKEGMADNDEERETCLSTIIGECDRMLAVIEDILRLGRAENAGKKPAKEQSARQTAKEVCRALRPQAEKKDIALILEGDTPVKAEEKDLWEILYNLLDNAIRYGKTGGEVRVRMEKGVIEVRDNGIGIAPDHLPHIFEPFYRVDDTRDVAPEGTGLGLSIVQALMKRLDGTIHAESDAGTGTRIILHFPTEERKTK